MSTFVLCTLYDNVIKWKYFPRYWPFVWGIHRSRWIPRTNASEAELWCFLWSAPNKRLSKQSWGWWFETPSWSLWCHCNGLNLLQKGDEHGALTEVTDVDHVKTGSRQDGNFHRKLHQTGALLLGHSTIVSCPTWRRLDIEALSALLALCVGIRHARSASNAELWWCFLLLAVGPLPQQNVQRVHYSYDVQYDGIKPRKTKHG